MAMSTGYAVAVEAGGGLPGQVDWGAIEAVVDRSPSFEDLRAHGLHLIGAARRRAQARHVPAWVVEEERLAARRLLAVPPLLRTIRAACSGPMVLMKGYEVALRYPDPVFRPFGDVDLLVPDPERFASELRAAGFLPAGRFESYYDTMHHLQPLYLPRLPLVVEVHRRPEWVRWCPAPPVSELFEQAVPSRAEIEGIDTLAPAHHALVVAAHSWAGAPLRRLSDIIDCTLLAGDATSGDLSEWARRWDVEGLWRFMERFREALVDDVPATGSVPAWSINALRGRDATVLEQHRRRLLAGFAVLPRRRALRLAAGELLREFLPARDETWPAKLSRMRLAVRHAYVARARHEATLREKQRPRP